MDTRISNLHAEEPLAVGAGRSLHRARALLRSSTPREIGLADAARAGGRGALQKLLDLARWLAVIFVAFVSTGISPEGAGVLLAQVKPIPTPIPIPPAPESQITLRQVPRAIRLEVGAARAISLLVDVPKVMGCPDRVGLKQIFNGVPGGIVIRGGFPAKGTVLNSPRKFSAHFLVAGAKSGSYSVITMATCIKTGTSFRTELPVEVTERGTPDPLVVYSPFAYPSGVPPFKDSVVKFQVAIGGTTTGPDVLYLDEVDINGVLVKGGQAVAQLRNDGTGSDQFAKDRFYSGTLRIPGAPEGERYYRVRAEGYFGTGKDVTSGIATFGITGFNLEARPSDPKTLVKDQEGRYLFATEVVVRLRPGVAANPNRINQIAGSVGGKMVGVIPAIRTYLLEFPGNGTASGVSNAIASLVKFDEVAHATPNFQVMAQAGMPSEAASACPTDAANCQWHIEHVGIDRAWEKAGGGLPDASPSVPTPTPLSIALVEMSDVYGSHPDLQGQCLGACNFDTAQGSCGVHATWVAGTLAAKADNGGIAGVAFASKLQAHKAVTAYQFIQAIQNAPRPDDTDTPSIINLSYSIPATDAADDPLREAVEDALCGGVLIVAAAGNVSCGYSADKYPAAFAKDTLLPPLQCGGGSSAPRGILAVGATDINDGLAQYSYTDPCTNNGGTYCTNTATWTNIFAPGENIYTTRPTNDYAYVSGTSLATPIVSGAAAVVWAKKPSGGWRTAEDIRDKLVYGATMVNGNPIINVEAALGAPTDLLLTPAAPSVKEDCSNVPGSGVVATVSSIDLDVSETFTYSFVDGSGNAVPTSGPFQIGSSGEITVVAGCPLDYETAAAHSLKVRVADSTDLTFEKTTTIAVTNVYEAPPSLNPTITFGGKEPYQGSDGKYYNRYRIPVMNWQDYPPEMFAQTAAYGPCGLNATPSRTWVDIFDAPGGSRIYGFCAFSEPQNLTSIWFAVPEGKKPPENVYIELYDRQTGIRRGSNILAIP